MFTDGCVIFSVRLAIKNKLVKCRFKTKSVYCRLMAESPTSPFCRRSHSASSRIDDDDGIGTSSASHRTIRIAQDVTSQYCPSTAAISAPSAECSRVTDDAVDWTSATTSARSRNHVTSTAANTKMARLRTVLSSRQLHMLRTCYAMTSRPDQAIKDRLAEMTGLPSRVIRVWFQNKRCKDKKRRPT